MDDDDTDVLVVVMVQNSRCSVSDGDRLAPQSCNVRRPAPGLEKDPRVTKRESCCLQRGG